MTLITCPRCIGDRVISDANPADIHKRALCPLCEGHGVVPPDRPEAIDAIRELRQRANRNASIIRDRDRSLDYLNDLRHQERKVGYRVAVESGYTGTFDDYMAIVYRRDGHCVECAQSLSRMP